MKILMPIKDKDGGGRANFLKRLAVSVRECGHDAVASPKYGYDVSINPVRLLYPKKKPRILRVDGAAMDVKMDYGHKNRFIAKSLRDCDGVIYQSEYSKKLCDSLVSKTKKPYAIIHNGAPVVDRRSAMKNGVPRLKYRYNFVTASRWRPHKRLKEIVAAFRMADIEDSCLWILGENYKGCVDSVVRTIKEDNIIYVGKVSPDTVRAYYAIADAVVHLCWLDACPNSVVEALSLGVPVITNNVGGTPELVKKCGGIICDIDKPYTYNAVDLYNPQRIDVGVVADGMIRAIAWRERINVEPIDINNIADKYISFMKRFI